MFEAYKDTETSLNQKFNTFLHDTDQVGNLEPYLSGNKIKGGVGGIDRIYSKKNYRYGLFVLNAQLATRSDTAQFFGFETYAGSQTLSGFFTLGTTFFRASVRAFGTAPSELSIESRLPANYNTAKHIYIVKANRNNVIFWIDSSIVSICLLSVQEKPPFFDNVLPYCVDNVPGTYVDSPMFLGMEGNPSIEMGDFYRNSPIAEDGDPITALNLPLYTQNTSTKWNGMVTSSPVTSHPIPVWGYEGKTLTFQSNAGGTLKVEIYTGGGWRQVTSQILTANTLWVYNLNYEATIVRCVYDPVGVDTIQVAEWALR